MNLSPSELMRLAESLDTTELRFVASGHSESTPSERKNKRRSDRQSDEKHPHQALAKLSRTQLIDHVVELAGHNRSVAHRLCETVELPARKVREWLIEREPDAPRQWIDKAVKLLVEAYEKGRQSTTVPASAVVGLLASGELRQILADVEELKRELGETARVDARTVMIRRRRREELARLLDGIGTPESGGFRPDDFQLEAVDLVLNQGTDVMVSAPTGSGKTWIAEQAIRGTLERGQCAWYTSPLKALSNDKFREFGRIFGPENVGIITGDRRVNPDAPLKIATTEIYRNGLYDSMNGLEAHDRGDSPTRLVVFDEVHYLGDRERGVVWEEAIIYTPPEARILMLSATVGNAEELTRWVEHTRGVPCRLVFHPERPVPLRTAFVHPNGRLQPFFTDEDGSRLHPDIQALYAAAHHEMESRKSRRRPFYRRKY